MPELALGSMNGRRVPERNERVVFQYLVEGDAVLLHLDSGQYHGLNATGSAIWELVDGNRDLRAIAGELQTDLSDAPCDLLSRVEGFLDELAERDLVTFNQGG